MPENKFDLSTLCSWKFPHIILLQFWVSIAILSGFYGHKMASINASCTFHVYDTRHGSCIHNSASFILFFAVFIPLFVIVFAPLMAWIQQLLDLFSFCTHTHKHSQTGCRLKVSQEGPAYVWHKIWRHFAVVCCQKCVFWHPTQIVKEKGRVFWV